MIRGLISGQLRGLADEELMGRCCEGDTRAFEVIVDRHSGPAYSLAFRMCGRRAIAEEIVQEAFVSLWRNCDRYEAVRGSVRSWVLAMVHNRAVDSFRRDLAKEARVVHDETLAERLEASERTDREVERREAAVEVRGALDTLPPEQRRVIELAYFGGFTNSQIAELLSIPAGTVKGRMRLGLSKLRVALGDTAAVLP